MMRVEPFNRDSCERAGERNREDTEISAAPNIVRASNPPFGRPLYLSFIAVPGSVGAAVVDRSLMLLESMSPSLSPVPHPSVPSARAVARAAGRARMRKDGHGALCRD